MQTSSIHPLFSSVSAITAAVREASSDTQLADPDLYIWELLHKSDHHSSDARSVSDQGLRFLSKKYVDSTASSMTVGSPDWVFVCGEWNPHLDSALILRDSRVVAAIQKLSGQLYLSTFDLLSARLIEGLFELGDDALIEDDIGQRFWQRSETVSWRLGLRTLGYTLKPFSAEVSDRTELEEKAEQLQILSNECLPAAFAACQLRILYKYG